MKITIKTLQGKQLPLEVEETDTVGPLPNPSLDPTSERKGGS
jgi:hypothetical protein